MSENRSARWFVQALARLGEFYWSPIGWDGHPREWFRALADAEWKEALAAFLERCAFERAGASPYYAPAAAAAVRAYTESTPGEDFELVMWHEFLHRVGVGADGKGANALNNPLAPSRPPTQSITHLVTRLGQHGYNIVRWARDEVAAGHVGGVSGELTRTRGIGTKIASFYLRDVAVACGIDESRIDAATYLQPIDTWTRRGAEALAAQLDLQAPQNDKEAARVIVEVSRRAGVQPSLLNTGLWMFGARLAQRDAICRQALAGPEALHDFLVRHRDMYTARSAGLDEMLQLPG